MTTSYDYGYLTATATASVVSVVTDGIYPTALGCTGFLTESPPIYGAVGRTPINQIAWDGIVNCCGDNNIEIWADGDTCEAYCYASSSGELAEEYLCLADVPYGTDGEAVTECLDDGSGICDVLYGLGETASDSYFTASETGYLTTSTSTSTATSTTTRTSSLSTITASTGRTSPAASSSRVTSTPTSSTASTTASSTSYTGAATTGKVELGLAAMMLIGALAM